MRRGFQYLVAIMDWARGHTLVESLNELEGHRCQWGRNASMIARNMMN
jgi:hypothetical protein